jgi:hypothetical protein
MALLPLLLLLLLVLFSLSLVKVPGRKATVVVRWALLPMDYREGM